MKTLIEYGEFKGTKTLSIWEVDSSGNKKSNFPLLTFGKKKAEAIMENKEEIEKFAEGKEGLHGEGKI